MKRLKNISAIIGAAVLGVFFALPASAQINTGLSQIASNTVLGTSDIRVIIARIIYVALGILGVIVLGIIIYAGFLWMTAGGDDDKVAQAKKWIFNGVVGLVIILSSYALTAFIIGKLVGAIGGEGGPSNESRARGGFSYDFGSLGEGIIKSHYPAPGASDVARNTKIIVTFKVPMNPETLIINGSSVVSGANTVYQGDVNPQNVRLVLTSALAGSDAFATSSDKLTAMRAYTVDNSTYVFAPVQYLGSPSTNMSYTMALGTGILLADGKTPAFTGNFSNGYHWEFGTGTTVDVTPPKVISIMPSPGSTVARNALIEVTFNEAVDPTSATGKIPGFTNVTVMAGGSAVAGVWEPSNQYRTIGYHTDIKGGTNSCGDDVYVLPGGAKIDVTVKAATVGSGQSGEPEAPLARYYPPDGVTDIVGNSLDGNGNGVAVGPPVDSVAWSFDTTNALELTPPKISNYDPMPEDTNVDLGKPLGIGFNRPMSITSLSNENLHLASRPNLPLWYFGEGQNLDVNGDPVTSIETPVRSTEALIVHERLAPTVGLCVSGVRDGSNCAVDGDCPGGTCHKTVYLYYPAADSGVRDIYQNCFLPACNTDPTRPYCCVTAQKTEQSCATACAPAADGGLICGSK